MSKREHDDLTAAAEAALRAPSVFNTQPWRWRIDSASLELYADRDRLLATVDPDAQQLLISCGAALHHARVALAAAGWRVSVEAFPDPGNDDFLARIRLREPGEPTHDERAMFEAIPRRRTDRRPFTDQAIPDVEIRELVVAAEREGVRLHEATLEQLPMLAIAVAAAQAHERTDAEYRGELRRWTNRPVWSNDGVPPATAVAHVARRVPVRDFVEAPNEGIAIEPGGDRGARYLILYGTGAGPADWLRAGEAASAVLLTAVSAGLAVAPMSDVIEVEHPRTLLQRMLPGQGHPYLVIRCGYAAASSTNDRAPRRTSAEVVDGPQP